jgi:pimeloyl-ACP methyl ester carboxylesterase
MRLVHSICAFLLLLAVSPAAQQAPAPPQGDTRAYLVFLGGSAIGREQLTVISDATGTTLTGRSTIGAPVNLTTRLAEIRYRPDWTPVSVNVDATLNGAPLTFQTTLDAPAPRTFILPNAFFTANEALGRWLATSADMTGDMHAFVAPGVDIAFRVASTGTERMQSGTTAFDLRTYDLRFANPTGEAAVTLATTSEGALVRLSVPAQGLEIVREDLATALARRQTFSHPGDAPVMIPAAGFNLGATMTRPSGATLPARLPAVVLLAGSGANDRDGTAAGIPIIGQIAGALADAGFLVVRYDKRGYGQSGGRAESATLSDFAEDARAVVNWLRRRDDVDDDRIAVIGHSEGAMVALTAASRERRIAAVGAIAAPSVTGAELILEQQQYALEQMKAPPAERGEKVALQQKIQQAVLTGRGWEGIPPEVRRQADTPWFQSLLAWDPREVIEDIDQPLLVVHGQLDRQVPVAHADRLANLAQAESDSRAVEVVIVRGVNHLLVPATTGDVSEYPTLTDRNVSREVTMALTAWLTKSLAAVR